MDVLSLSEILITHPYSIACAKIRINGEPLIEMAREYEMPIARVHNEESIAGGYQYQPAKRLYLLLTEGCPYHDDNMIPLLVCHGCMEEGCWPLEAWVEEINGDVMWKDFRNPHRKDSDRFWDYSGFGPFRFDRQDYWREVEKLKTFF